MNTFGWICPSATAGGRPPWTSADREALYDAMEERGDRT